MSEVKSCRYILGSDERGWGVYDVEQKAFVARADNREDADDLVDEWNDAEPAGG